MCKKHYIRFRRHGSTDKPAKSKGWGKRFTMVAGYKYLLEPLHPNAQANGYVAEHVVVMSEALGRPLIPGENVHHLNGVRDDNRLENLELWTKSQPAGQRVTDKIKWAIELLEQYSPEDLNPGGLHRPQRRE